MLASRYKDSYSCCLSSHTEVLSNPILLSDVQTTSCRRSTAIPDLPVICGASVTADSHCGQDAYFNLPLFSSAGGMDDRKFVLALCCNHLKPERNYEELEISTS